MTSKIMWFSLVSAFLLVVLSVANVSASFGKIVGLEVNEVDALHATSHIAVEAGETIPVRVIFTADSTVEDVRVMARISGDKDFAAVTKEVAVLKGNTYSWLLSVKVPSNLDEENLNEALGLNVIVEGKDEGVSDAFGVDLTLQRESNALEILDVNMNNEINAGDNLNLDVVVKNRGRQTSEDTFVVARIPALKIESKSYFGDLYSMADPVINGRQLNNRDDSNERRLSLKLPSDAPAGVYIVEIEASNADAITTVTKKIVVTGAQKGTQIVAPVHSRSVNSGETAEYTLVLVNSGNQLGVYELVIESPGELNVDVSDPVVAIPAGTSKTIKLGVKADKAGTYNFAVNVHSGNELVTREEFTTMVQGTNGQAVITKTSPTVLLTVVLAVIFVVLLIVLIVLLTRRPEKSEEFGESYY